MSNIQPQCNKRKRRFHGAGTEFPNMKEIEKRMNEKEKSLTYRNGLPRSFTSPYTILIPKPQLGNA